MVKMQEAASEQLVLRVQPGTLRRAEALKAKVAKDPNLSAVLGRVSRSTVLKLALARGLEALEKEYK